MCIWFEIIVLFLMYVTTYLSFLNCSDYRGGFYFFMTISIKGEDLG